MLNKSLIIIVILLFTAIITVSGCTTPQNATNGTFGEKTISIKNLTIINNVTTDRYDYDGVNYYYIEGYIKNNNKYDAFKIKMKATAYDKDGNVVATNSSVYLDPKSIPTGGQSYFFFQFVDQDQIIVRYDLQVLNASVVP